MVTRVFDKELFAGRCDGRYNGGCDAHTTRWVQLIWNKSLKDNNTIAKHQLIILFAGMAYGLLAGVTPSSGLYMAFFPTLVYFIFGTSRHISVGTLSIISVMTLKVVQTYSHIPEAATSGSATNVTVTVAPSDGGYDYTPMQVVTATAFMCGVHQVSVYTRVIRCSWIV